MSQTKDCNNDEGRHKLNWQSLVDSYYGASEAKEILIGHSRAVAEFAQEINVRKQLNLDPEEVEFAAMLHDIGILRTHAPSIRCFGNEPYICHGSLGADMLREAGAPEWSARVAERHTGAGLTPDDIERQGLTLPPGRIYLPETLLEKLICYADKFYSKRPGGLSSRKSLEKVRLEMLRHGDDTLKRFDTLHALFG